MTQAQVALVPDRLPWLPEEAAPANRAATGGGRGIAGWLVAAALFVAGTAYVVADRTFGSRSGVPQPWSPSTTAILPQLPTAREASRPERVPAPAPENSNPTTAVPATALPANADAGRSLPAPARNTASSAMTRPTPPPTTTAHPKIATPNRSAPATHRLLPVSSYSTAASLLDMRAPRPPSQLSGQVIHLGAFADIRRADAAWRDMTRAYPPLQRFHASLIQNRDWNGQPFYQFEVGTASQADSEVLCQMMARFSYRCAVAGPRGKQTASARR